MFFCYLKYVLFALLAAYAMSKVIINLRHLVFQITVIIMEWMKDRKQFMKLR